MSKALFFAILAICLAQAIEEVPINKPRFSHAEFYYPRGKYDSLNKVIEMRLTQIVGAKDFPGD